MLTGKLTMEQNQAQIEARANGTLSNLTIGPLKPKRLANWITSRAAWHFHQTTLGIMIRLTVATAVLTFGCPAHSRHTGESGIYRPSEGLLSDAAIWLFVGHKPHFPPCSLCIWGEIMRLPCVSSSFQYVQRLHLATWLREARSLAQPPELSKGRSGNERGSSTAEQRANVTVHSHVKPSLWRPFPRPLAEQQAI